MTFDLVKGHMTYADWVIDQCDQVSQLEGTSGYMVDSRKVIWLTEEP